MFCLVYFYLCLCLSFLAMDSPIYFRYKYEFDCPSLNFSPLCYEYEALSDRKVREIAKLSARHKTSHWWTKMSRLHHIYLFIYKLTVQNFEKLKNIILFAITDKVFITPHSLQVRTEILHLLFKMSYFVIDEQCMLLY